MTKTQALIRALEKKGSREVESPSTKYRKFVLGNLTLWVGRSGALRTGRTATASRSLTDGKIYDNLLKLGGYYQTTVDLTDLI